MAGTLTVKVLQAMAQEIAELLLLRFSPNQKSVDVVLDAAKVDEGVRINVQASLQTGEVLFAIQTDLHSAWLEESSGLSHRITFYTGIDGEIVRSGKSDIGGPSGAPPSCHNTPVIVPSQP